MLPRQKNNAIVFHNTTLLIINFKNKIIYHDYKIISLKNKLYFMLFDTIMDFFIIIFKFIYKSR